ncbi:M24 family metallopeptidase [Alsobacter sp. R-9]
MHDPDALKREFERRVGHLQALMHRLDLDGLFVGGNGSPDGVASVRWLTGARAWAGVLVAVLLRDDPAPYVVSHSSYQALWARRRAATHPDRVEWSSRPVSRAVERLAAARRPGRIGVVARAKMAATDHDDLSVALRDVDLVDVTGAFDALRRQKSRLEIEEFEDNGARLSRALQIFADRATPGVPLIETALAAEAEARRDGGFWSRAKVAVGPVPYTIPPEPGETMPADEVVTCELVTESPLGYWTEMTVHVTCGAVPDETARLFDAYWAASEAAMAAARPGVRQGEIGRAGDAVLAAHGFPPAGRHTPDCHSIGLDGADGPSNSADPEFVLQEGMVLSMHPGAITAGDRGFLVSDNGLVTAQGARRLSPHGRERRWIVKPA